MCTERLHPESLKDSQNRILCQCQFIVLCFNQLWEDSLSVYLIHCCAFLFSTPCNTFCPSGKHLHWRKHGCTHSMKRRYKFYDAIHSTLMIVIRIRQALLCLQCNTRFLLMATMMPQVSCFVQCLRKLKDNTRRPWRECPLIPWWVCFFNLFKFGLEPLSVRSFSGRKLQLPIFRCNIVCHVYWYTNRWMLHS